MVGGPCPDFPTQGRNLIDDANRTQLVQRVSANSCEDHSDDAQGNDEERLPPLSDLHDVSQQQHNDVDGEREAESFQTKVLGLFRIE